MNKKQADHEARGITAPIMFTGEAAHDGIGSLTTSIPLGNAVIAESALASLAIAEKTLLPVVAPYTLGQPPSP